jgi:hypothetical protein
MTSQLLGGGEFTLRLVPRQKVAPLYWRSDTHTHVPHPVCDKGAIGSAPQLMDNPLHNRNAFTGPLFL